MIDLHLHTNASDGQCTAGELVERARGARLAVIAVTDHDTLAAVAETSRLAAADGIRVVPGIEITAVWQDLDVHILGYYVDLGDDRLATFLASQRVDRVRRVHDMLERLRALGAPIAFDDVVAPVAGALPHAIGRPQVARALVRAGAVADTREAFDRYLGEGRPAYVPRIGAEPSDVVRLIVDAGGIASLAHPGLLHHDELVPSLVAAGMQAIEVYHPDHDGSAMTHYLEMARRYHLVVTGGSDYHADAAHGAPSLGVVTLPPAHLERLDALAARQHR